MVVKNNVNNQNEHKKKIKVWCSIWGRRIMESVGEGFQYTKKMTRVITV